MQKSVGPRYGLKNASAYLHKLRSQKTQHTHWQSSYNDNEKQQTFDNCEIPSSKESPQKSHIFVKQRKKNSQHGNSTKMVNSLMMSETENIQEFPMNKSAQGEGTIAIGLADLVIREHLGDKLKIYQEDLKQLVENRDNLVEAIEDLAGKIQSLHEIQDKNQILELENFKNKKQILNLVKHYHELRINLQSKKIKLQQNFQTKKDKLKLLLDIMPEQNQYVVQAESWNQYFYELAQNKLPQIENPNQEKVLAQIFPKIDQPTEPKKKQKPKNSVDKSGLLGDLKSFAKNFKMPANPPSQT